MEYSEILPAWHSSIDLRISHPKLDPSLLSKILNAEPVIAQNPGESRVPYGVCKSAGFWSIQKKIEYPERPDVLFLWAEDFVSDRESYLSKLIDDEYNVNFYVGIHTTVMTIGFNLPATPVIQKLGIPIGVEFFSK